MGKTVALLFYVAATLVMTWPVAAGLTDHLPNDLGDPAFVSYMLAWGSYHWLDLLSGDLTAVVRFWSSPIFYPEPLATAYSEHFALHSLLTLPVFAITRNAVLCYNLWFIATFALAGFCMFLLVRAITPRLRSGQACEPWAALVAGLAFAFAPYRFGGSLGHLQVLSSFWMPLVLLGLHRYFETGRVRHLAGAGAAMWAQALASGYFLIYFAPFAVLFAVMEMAARKRLTDLRTWLSLIASATVTAIAILPFVWPYLTLQRMPTYKRSIAETELYSADLASWVTASKQLHLWSWLRTYDKAEGWLFPGLTTVLLAVIGLIVALRLGDRRQRAIAAFAGITIVLTAWIALGPTPTLMGERVAIPSVYRLLYDYVPGYSAARVPSRMTMITTVATSLLAGLALATFDRAGRRWLIAIAAAALIAESAAMPLPIDVVLSSAANVRPPDRLFAERDAPPVYKFLKTLPGNTVIAELPFGLPEREIQYAYYSVVHRHRIANGYSGYYPESYLNRQRPLQYPADTFGTMYSLLTEEGVTHVVVHVDAWSDDTGQRVVKIFEGTGFPLVARFGNDYVFSLKAPA